MSSAPDGSPRSRRRLPGLIDAAAGGLLLITLAAWCGSLHWLLDVAANFRWHLWLAALLGLAVTVRRRGLATRACLAAAALGNGWPLLPYWLPPAAEVRGSEAHPGNAIGGRLALVTLNVHGRNRDRDRVVRYLRDRSADVVALLEVDDFWEGVIAELADIYPRRHVHARKDFYGLALLSRHPLEEVRVVELGGAGLPSLVARLRPDGTDVMILATHPRAPIHAGFARDRDRQLRAIADLVASGPLPWIVVGDLNATPFAAAFRDLVDRSGLCDTALGRGVQATWNAHLPLPGVPIDHVLVPPSVLVTHRAVGPFVGSDHLPVEATIRMPR